MATVRPVLRYEQTEDRQVNQIQRNINEVFRTVMDPEWIFGHDVRELTFTAGQTRSINHGLGRAPRGFIVIDAQLNPALLSQSNGGVATVDITSVNAGIYAIRFY